MDSQPGLVEFAPAPNDAAVLMARTACQLADLYMLANEDPLFQGLARLVNRVPQLIELLGHFGAKYFRVESSNLSRVIDIVGEAQRLHKLQPNGQELRDYVVAKKATSELRLFVTFSTSNKDYFDVYPRRMCTLLFPNDFHDPTSDPRLRPLEHNDPMDIYHGIYAPMTLN